MQRILYYYILSYFSVISQAGYILNETLSTQCQTDGTVDITFDFYPPTHVLGLFNAGSCASQNNSIQVQELLSGRYSIQFNTQNCADHNNPFRQELELTFSEGILSGDNFIALQRQRLKKVCDFLGYHKVHFDFSINKENILHAADEVEIPVDDTIEYYKLALAASSSNIEWSDNLNDRGSLEFRQASGEFCFAWHESLGDLFLRCEVHNFSDTSFTVDLRRKRETLVYVNASIIIEYGKDLPAPAVETIREYEPQGVSVATVVEVLVVPHPDSGLYVTKVVGGIVFKTQAWTDPDHTFPVSGTSVLYSSDKIYVRISHEVSEFLTGFVFAPWRCVFKSNLDQEYTLFHVNENNCRNEFDELEFDMKYQTDGSWDISYRLFTFGENTASLYSLVCDLSACYDGQDNHETCRQIAESCDEDYDENFTVWNPIGQS